MSSQSPVRPGVLSGVRVLDFTWKTVGPWAPRLLTHYGAEVIHVERAGGYDDHRYNATASIVSDEPQAAQLPIGPELQPSATSPSLAPVPF